MTNPRAPEEDLSPRAASIGEVEARHAHYYTSLAQRAAPSIEQDGEQAAATIRMLEQEWPNISKAQNWAARNCESDQGATMCRTLADACIDFIRRSRHASDGIRFFLAAVSASRHLQDRQGEECCLGNLGIFYDAVGDTQLARTSFEAALSIARDTGDCNGVARSMHVLASLALARGDTMQAIDLSRQAADAFAKVGNDNERASATAAMADGYYQLGRVKHAISIVRRLLREKERSGAHTSTAGLLVQLATYHIAVGAIQEASVELGAALARRRITKDRQGEISALGQLGVCFAEAGRHEEALACCLDVLGLSRMLGLHREQCGTLINLAMLRTRLGDCSAADQELATAYSMASESANLIAAARALANTAELHLRSGLIEQAPDFASRAAEIYERMGDARSLAYTGLLLGRIAIKAKRPRDCIDLIARARPALVTAGAKPLLLQAAEACGQAHHMAGEPAL